MPTGNPLNHVTTPANIEKTRGLSQGTVRQYLTRHADEMIERGVLLKIDDRTWLMLKTTADSIWGKVDIAT